MDIAIDAKLLGDLERFARLYTSAQAWLVDLEATHADIQQHLDSPMGRAVLLVNGACDTVSLDQNDVLGSGGALSLLQQLETCETQEQICEVMARANNSTIDLRDAIPQIRKAGLAKETTPDRGLTKNLGSRLIESGRWDRARPGVYKLKGFLTAEDSTARVVDGLLEPSRSSVSNLEEVMTPGVSLDACRTDVSSCLAPAHDFEPSLSEIDDSSYL